LADASEAGIPERIKSLKAQCESLRNKMSIARDPEIRDAIQMKITALEEDCARLEKFVVVEEETAPAAPPAPATPEQIEEADHLIQRARLESIRGNKQGASDLMRQAAEAAPTAPSVLEAIADELLARGQTKEAVDRYAQAMRLSPNNVGLEKKHASAVFRASGAMFMESQMALEGKGDVAANASWATLLSVFVPGSGQIVLGSVATGVTMLVVWIGMLIWFVVALGMAHLKPSDFTSGRVPGSVLTPGIIALVIHVGGIMASVTRAKAVAVVRGPRKVEHPQPPVNLPFD